MPHNYFYQRYKRGRGERGKNGIAAKISTVRKELREAHGLTQPEIARAVTFLIDESWLRRDEEESMFQTKGGVMRPSKSIYYRITSEGVKKIEGDSEYNMPKRDGISIHANGSVVTIGDGNRVSAEIQPATHALADLRDVVAAAADLDEGTKVSLSADLATMELQLQKPVPNKSLLRTVWDGIEKSTVATSLMNNVAAITPLLRPLLA